MYVTVRRYEGVTDPTEAGRRVNEGFLAIISKVPGFVAYYWVDAGGGVMISTSIFENQSGAEESTKRAADYVREKMASLLPKPPQITAGGDVAHKAKEDMRTRPRDGTSATDDLIVRQPFEPVRKTGGLFCRFENSPIDAEQAWSFLSE